MSFANADLMSFYGFIKSETEECIASLLIYYWHLLNSDCAKG